MNPTVSILSLAYNHGPYVGACLESVLNQTFEDWELLVLDDGSTDHTWEVIQSYAQEDARIRAFRQENRGVTHLAANLNALLLRARGELVSTVAGDDYWPLDRLAIQVPVHREGEVVLSYGRVVVFSERGPLREYPRPPGVGTFSTTEVLNWLLTIRACIQPVSVMMDREALVRVGGFRQYAQHPVEDYPTYLEVLTLPGQVHYLDALLGYWRVSEQQITKRYAAAIPEAALYAAERHFEALSAHLKEALGLTKADILTAHYSRTLLPSYLSAMRYALLSRDRKEAAHYARKLIRHGTLKRKLQGVCGLLVAPLGGHLEPIFDYSRPRAPKLSP